MNLITSNNVWINLEQKTDLNKWRSYRLLPPNPSSCADDNLNKMIFEANTWTGYFRGWRCYIKVGPYHSALFLHLFLSLLFPSVQVHRRYFSYRLRDTAYIGLQVADERGVGGLRATARRLCTIRCSRSIRCRRRSWLHVRRCHHTWWIVIRRSRRRFRHEFHWNVQALVLVFNIDKAMSGVDNIKWQWKKRREIGYFFYSIIKWLLKWLNFFSLKKGFIFLRDVSINLRGWVC